MDDLYLRDLHCNGNEFTIFDLWDGDIVLQIKDERGLPIRVTIGMGNNSGDPNGNIEDIRYIKGALKNLLMEFKYQSGEITKEEIRQWRDTPKVPSYLEGWFEDD